MSPSRCGVRAKVGGDGFLVELASPSWEALLTENPACAVAPIGLVLFRVHLMGDTANRKMFYGASCTLCTDSRVQVTQNSLMTQ
jgi:hypothetical protein